MTFRDRILQVAGAEDVLELSNPTGVNQWGGPGDWKHEANNAAREVARQSDDPGVQRRLERIDNYFTPIADHQTKAGVPYTIYQRADRASDFIAVRNDDAREIASVTVRARENDDGSLTIRDSVSAARMEDDYRRQGIGTAMYAAVERTLGITLKPSETQTPAAEAFWKSRQLSGDDEFQSEMQLSTPLLDALSTHSSAFMAPSVRAIDIFGRAPAAIVLPLNRKTTESNVQTIPLTDLEPTQLFIAAKGLAAYMIRSRRDPSDVAHIVMRDGRERMVIQEGHTRLGAAILRGDLTADVRVWEFVEDAAGKFEPVPRGLHKRGLTWRQKMLSFSGVDLGDRSKYPDGLYPGERDSQSRDTWASDDAISQFVDQYGDGFLTPVDAQGRRSYEDVMFHGTASTALESIKSAGLIPLAGKGADAYASEVGLGHVAGFMVGDRATSVYMAFDSKTARMYAGMAERANPGSKAVMLAIRVPPEARGQIKGDEHEAQGQRFVGTIRSEWIRVVNQDGSLKSLSDDAGTIYGVLLVAPTEPIALGDRSKYPDGLYPSEREGAGKRPARLTVPKDAQGRPLKKDGTPFTVVQAIDTDWNNNWATERTAPAITQAVVGTKKPEDVGGLMFASLPGDVTMQVGVMDMGTERVVRVVAFTPKEGNPAEMESTTSLYVAREFTRKEDGTLEVKHDIFQVPPGQQGSGLAKQVLADSMAVYEQLGVTAVTTDANIDVGGYAWAKFGFKAADPQGFAGEVVSRVAMMTKANEIPSDRAKQVLSIVRDHMTDPKLPWRIASVTDGTRPLGKEIMMGSSWSAKLDLKDAEAMRRFNDYVGRK